MCIPSPCCPGDVVRARFWRQVPCTCVSYELKFPSLSSLLSTLTCLGVHDRGETHKSKRDQRNGVRGKETQPRRHVHKQLSTHTNTHIHPAHKKMRARGWVRSFRGEGM